MSDLTKVGNGEYLLRNGINICKCR